MQLESADRFAGKFFSILVWVGGWPKKNFRFLAYSSDAVQKATSVADMWQPPISNRHALTFFPTQPESTDRFAGKFLSISVWVGGYPKKNFRFVPYSGDAVQKATSVADMWQPPISNKKICLFQTWLDYVDRFAMSVADMWQPPISNTRTLPCPHATRIRWQIYH